MGWSLQIHVIYDWMRKMRIRTTEEREVQDDSVKLVKQFCISYDNITMADRPPLLTFRQRLSSFAAHSLLCRGNHNKNWLSIQAGMRKPATDLTTFLTKGTCVAEDMSSKVASSLTLFTLQLIFHKASTAPAWPVKSFTATLLINTRETTSVRFFLFCNHIISLSIFGF